jgi:flotillin
MFTLIVAVSSLTVVALIIFWLLSLRRIVPTNMVHIVQRRSQTISYGIGFSSNIYYEFPAWMPIIGVTVTHLPRGIFDIDLADYSAYDKDRVPFIVDIKGFFHVADTNKAAEKLVSFDEMLNQLKDIVRGSVRSILAKSPLEDILEERSTFGEKFTSEIREDLKSWGIEVIKNIELMDVRDASGSNVIKQIMAKRMAVIDKESRLEVAKSKRDAEIGELEANKEIALASAETRKLSGEALARSEQAIKIAQAISAKEAGVAQQGAERDIAEAEIQTKQQQMEVIKVNEIRQAEIDKEKGIINSEQRKKMAEIAADAQKYQTEINAAALMEAKKKEAEGLKSMGEAEAEIIKLKGISEAESKKAMELAGVTAQTTLAKEIGENKPYQDYLVRIREVEVTQIVGVGQARSLAQALSQADLKLLVNSGDVHSGIGKLSDIFTSKGGSQINGLLEALKQTGEGEDLLTNLLNKLQK